MSSGMHILPAQTSRIGCMCFDLKSRQTDMHMHTLVVSICLLLLPKLTLLVTSRK